jgi:hypothetical protein
MADRDMEIGIICIIVAVFFMISGLDLLEVTLFSTGLSSLLAFVLVAFGSYQIGRSSK